MSRRLYTLLLYLVLPFVPLRLWWRAWRQPAYRRHWRERGGWYGTAPAGGPVIWIHAVSVGETRAAEPLVRALLARHPDHRILMTHMTPTGRETGDQLYGGRIDRAYLPYDYPPAVARFFEHFRPVCGVLMETELWPNLVVAARRRGIPVHLVNARLSEKSYRGYARHSGLARATLGALAGIAAQTDADAQRLRALGASRITVAGNLKFDVTPPAALVARGRTWREGYGARPVLLAASTRPGEEEQVLAAFAKLQTADVLLVLVPRHPERCAALADLLERRGLAAQRRSAGGPVHAATRVLLGDSLGEMFAYYAACDVAIMGGSLLDYGSQNLIEPCALGKPVLLGPSTYNFAAAAEQALACGAARAVSDADGLAAAADAVLSDPDAARRMGEAGLAFTRAHQGATERVLDLLGLTR